MDSLLLPSAKGGARKKAAARRKPERSSFPFKSPDGRRPDPAARGREHVGKDSLPNFPRLCSGGGRGGHPSWGVGGPWLSDALYGGHGGGGAPSRTEPRGPGPGPPPLRPWIPDPETPGRAFGPRPAAARLGGRGFESGRAYQVVPGSPRGQVHVRPLDCPRSRRRQAERVRDRRRPGPTPRPAFGAPLSPWPCDPNFPPSRGAGSFRASRALGSVSAATSELGNKEGKQARRGEERKKYGGEGAGYLEIPQPEIPPRSCLGLFFLKG